MSIISAPSLQAYRVWADPVRTERQVTIPVADPVERREKPVIVNLSPEAEKLVAELQTSPVKDTVQASAQNAADTYMNGASTGAGRREAPFAHREDAVRYQPPGRLVDRVI